MNSKAINNVWQLLVFLNKLVMLIVGVKIIESSALLHISHGISHATHLSLLHCIFPMGYHTLLIYLCFTAYFPWNITRYSFISASLHISHGISHATQAFIVSYGQSGLQAFWETMRPSRAVLVRAVSKLWTRELLQYHEKRNLHQVSIYIDV